MPVWMDMGLPLAGATVVSLLLRRRTEGLWQVLEVLARGRAAAVLERERRATATQLIRSLPEGGRWDETDENGRRRSIDVVMRPAAGAPAPPADGQGRTPGAGAAAGETLTAREMR